MTPQDVFRYYRAYKFFYDGHRVFKNGTVILKHPLLDHQHDRAYFYRIAQALSDRVVHALFTLGFFFNPRAHISNLVSSDAFKLALVFGSREENGNTIIKHELYALARPYQEPGADKEELLCKWLYGDPVGTMPECLRQVITGVLPLDLACLLLLIPQPTLGLHWTAFWAGQPDADIGLGPQPWIARLKKVDQLLRMQRPLWRLTSQSLAHEFWASLDVSSLAPGR